MCKDFSVIFDQPIENRSWEGTSRSESDIVKLAERAENRTNFILIG